jgi:hypothetical protein
MTSAPSCTFASHSRSTGRTRGRLALDSQFPTWVLAFHPCLGNSWNCRRLLRHPSQGSALVKKVEQPGPVEDSELINVLDDTWLSPPQIRARLASPAWSADVAAALERLADRGLIDRRTQEIKVHRRGGGILAIKHYRRRTA